MIHIFWYRHWVTGFIQVYKASSLRKRLGDQWVPLKYFLNGLRSEAPPQQIWNSHIILHLSWLQLVKFEIEIRFFTELHRNSKLLTTSCPSLSEHKAKLTSQGLWAVTNLVCTAMLPLQWRTVGFWRPFFWFFFTEISKMEMVDSKLILVIFKSEKKKKKHGVYTTLRAPTYIICLLLCQ